MIGNDHEIDTNICISSMLQDNQSAEKVLRKVISNEFSKPHQTLITLRICLFYSYDLLFLIIFNDLLK